MKTILGFWCFQRPSNYITRTVMVTYVDNGFGDLIPSPFPAHAINTMHQ